MSSGLTPVSSARIPITPAPGLGRRRDSHGASFPARLEVGEGQPEDLRDSPARPIRVRRHSAGFEPVVNDAGDAALEAAQRAVATVAFGDAALVVGLAGSVVDGLGDSDAVDGGVEAAVAVAGRAQAHCRRAGGVRDGGQSGA